MKRIVTHPDNEPLLRAYIEQNMPNASSQLWHIKVTLNKYVEATKSTGRLITNDGDVVEPGDFTCKWGQFVTLGPGDVELALKLGLVRKELAPQFFVIDDMQFSMQSKFELMIHQPRYLIEHGGV